MKRYLVPVVAGVTVFGAVTAFAATLNVTTTGLGSGNATVASCNASAVVSYTTSYSAALPGYQVATTPITSAIGCANKAYRVTLTGALNASLQEMTGNLDGTGAAAPAVTAGLLAANVTGVSVVISG
jgi:hypothetical protein